MDVMTMTLKGNRLASNIICRRLHCHRESLNYGTNCIAGTAFGPHSTKNDESADVMAMIAFLPHVLQALHDERCFPTTNSCFCILGVCCTADGHDLTTLIKPHLASAHHRLAIWMHERGGKPTCGLSCHLRVAQFLAHMGGAQGLNEHLSTASVLCLCYGGD